MKMVVVAVISQSKKSKTKRKAVSDMARYIDADALKTAILTKYRVNWEIPCSSEDRLIQRVVTDLRVLIEQSVTADVAPKSEVDWLYKQVDYLSQEVMYNDDIAKMKVDEAKAEVAREIFEEIEEYVIKGISVSGEHLTLFNGKNFAELKKKYAEEKE